MGTVLVGAALGLLFAGSGMALLGWSSPERVRHAKVVVVEGRAAVVEPETEDKPSDGPYRLHAELGQKIPALLREQRPGPSLHTVLGVLLTVLGVAFVVGGVIAAIAHPRPGPLQPTSVG